MMTVTFGRLFGPPHPRGGASDADMADHRATSSSPPTWGCLGARRAAPRGETVLPTHVGVPPTEAAHSRQRRRPPHPRGGASIQGRKRVVAPPSSPPTWGCLRDTVRVLRSTRVLPTHVGVPRNVHLSPREFDGLIWPRDAGLIWPHLGGTDADRTGALRGTGSGDANAARIPRRCTPEPVQAVLTRVGVPLEPGHSAWVELRLPHPRGGSPGPDQQRIRWLAVLRRSVVLLALPTSFRRAPLRDAPPAPHPRNSGDRGLADRYGAPE